MEDNSDGLKDNGAAVGTPPNVIIDSGISFSAGPTTDIESTACPLSSSTTIFSTQEYTVDCSATYNVAYTFGGVDYELTEKDLSTFLHFVDRRGSWSTCSCAIIA